MDIEVVNARAHQRAMCEILARVVPADRIVRKIEEDTLAEQVRELTGFARVELAAFLNLLAADRVDRTGPSASCILVKTHVPLETRKKLVRLLWDIAACDGVLHDLEQAYIIFVADLLEVPRKDVIAARDHARMPAAKRAQPRFASASVAELAASPIAINPRRRPQ
jgi:uncharacterized tellurite resistance protein B-like protein